MSFGTNSSAESGLRPARGYRRRAARVVFPSIGRSDKCPLPEAREPKNVVRLSVHAASGKVLKMAAKASATASRPSKTPPCGCAPEEDQKTQSSVIEAMIPSRSWAFQAATNRSSIALRSASPPLPQVLDLDEGIGIGVGVDHVVLDALPPRVGRVPLEASRPGASPGSSSRRSPSRSGNDDIVRHVAMPAGLGAGLEAIFGHSHMRLVDMDEGLGLLSLATSSCPFKGRSIDLRRRGSRINFRLYNVLRVCNRVCAALLGEAG